MKSIHISFACFIIMISQLTFSAVGASHVSGEITNITSVREGLLIRIGNNEVPENCTSGNAWMLIEQQHATMITTAITAWTLGKTADVYTLPASTGMCKVVQVDPAG